MKEKIYTIPVTDAFKEDCECPVCLLEKKLEDDYVDYTLGPSLMEPDGRIVTNDKGFCHRHFELLYNRKENHLGLGLIVDTHLVHQNEKMKRLYKSCPQYTDSGEGSSFVKNITNRFSARQTPGTNAADRFLSYLDELDSKCTICDKLEYTMDRYMDVILYLWFKEDDFRKLFNAKKGFCLKHLKLLLTSTKKYLNDRDSAIFTSSLLKMQVINMERIQQEINWFTKKFDYKNADAPWGNSRDALSRSIQKIAGYCDLK